MLMIPRLHEFTVGLHLPFMTCPLLTSLGKKSTKVIEKESLWGQPHSSDNYGKQITSEIIIQPQVNGVEERRNF